LGFLLRVFRKLRRENPGLKLVKIGRDGGGEVDFRARTVDAIRLLGLGDDVILRDFVPAEELRQYYRNAEVFCFPSLSEGFGWPPLEAMACGCPVVASNATAIPEVVGDGGVLSSPDDEAEWVEAIERLLEDKGFRQRVVVSGAARAAQFTWDRATRQVLELYEEVDAS
jgi:glycosyltransferase involved in cell wall biosynthesis